MRKIPVAALLGLFICSTALGGPFDSIIFRTGADIPLAPGTWANYVQIAPAAEFGFWFPFPFVDRLKLETTGAFHLHFNKVDDSLTLMNFPITGGLRARLTSWKTPLWLNAGGGVVWERKMTRAGTSVNIDPYMRAGLGIEYGTGRGTMLFDLGYKLIMGSQAKAHSFGTTIAARVNLGTVRNPEMPPEPPPDMPDRPAVRAEPITPPEPPALVPTADTNAPPPIEEPRGDAQ